VIVLTRSAFHFPLSNLESSLSDQSESVLHHLPGVFLVSYWLNVFLSGFLWWRQKLFVYLERDQSRTFHNTWGVGEIQSNYHCYILEGGKEQYENG
jgi:hypothetical protein